MNLRKVEETNDFVVYEVVGKINQWVIRKGNDCVIKSEDWGYSAWLVKSLDRVEARKKMILDGVI